MQNAIVETLLLCMHGMTAKITSLHTSKAVWYTIINSDIYSSFLNGFML